MLLDLQFFLREYLGNGYRSTDERRKAWFVVHFLTVIQSIPYIHYRKET